MRTVAIIQARMSSSRLPGKVLMPLAGRPVLWHIVHRLRKCKHVDEVAIATSGNPSDDPICSFAGSMGVKVVRGPEDNVLERYMIAAEELEADIVVRVTGDAPLIDPGMIDLLIETLVRKGADYCTGDPQVPCIHEGFCPLTYNALKKLVEEAGNDLAAKEHVTAYFKAHPDFVNIAYAPIDPDYQFAGARVSVDTPADLTFLEEVYARLNVPAGEADMRDVVRLLRSEPGLLKINAHVKRKNVNEKSRRVLFRCDGDSRIGLGHVVRSLALADEMRETFGCGVTFAMVTGEAGCEMVRKAGYPIVQNPGYPEDAWLDSVVRELRPDAVILDIRSELSSGAVENWRRDGVLIVAIDDPSDRRLAADMSFYPPVEQVSKMDWEAFCGRLFVGWEWVVLRREFSNAPERVPHEKPVVLITMGGSDPAGLTLKAVEGLGLLEETFDAVVVLGPGFTNDDALEKMLAKSSGKFEVRRNVSDMPGLMARADLAVASFGVTAYELAAVGVPAVYMCLTEDHEMSASAFAKAGIAVCLGVHEKVTPESVSQAVRSLLSDRERMTRMSRKAGSLVDGRGAIRIAELIAEEMRNKNAWNSPLETAQRSCTGHG
ncbi:MAG TPA: NTP transferase domain-containing protein [Bacillota bacterium]|nr:NTP transferase domain-containing protein [Bacillota bacterium]